MISCAIIIVSTARRNRCVSNEPSGRRNLRRFSDARLQALLSRCMYSLHGFDALMRPVLAAVFQRLMVVSYCMPGSALSCAASAIHRMTSRARTVSSVLPVVTALNSHIPSCSTACINSSVTRTELFAF